MTKAAWVKLFAQEGVRLILFAIAAFIFWRIFRKKGDNAKAAVSAAASIARAMPTL